MTITEYAENNNLKVGTVSAYIRRNHSDFDKHIKKTKGHTLQLDDVAIGLLNQRYKPKVEVVFDVQSHEKIEKLQSALIEIQQRTIMLQEEIIDLKASKLAIEMKLSDQEEELTRLKNRNLIDRILNR